MGKIAATFANAAWFASAWPDYRRYLAAIEQPRWAQEELLLEYLRRNANTDIGRRFDFASIDSVEQFQQRVPIHDCDALAADIDRIAAGEPNVLTHDPVRRLVPSSGSTRARKLIPYTDALQREFNRAINPWIVDLYQSDQDLMAGCAYWSITPVTRNGSDKIGFDEDSAYLGGFRKRLVDAVMAVPGDVRFLTDVADFRRATLDHLIKCRDLRLISVWHPSFFELLLDAGEPRDWRATWPNLRLISCWADAHAATPAAALASRLPHVPLQPKGLLATEAFVSIPFANCHPLAIRSHFFEFLTDDGRTLLADELQPGQTYSVLVTTAGGLYRYRLGDRVEVDGFVARTPSIRFVGRGDAVVDRFGEKLSEAFAASAIRAALHDCGVSASFSMLAPEETAMGVRYTLFMQCDDALPPRLVTRVDESLRANPHYAWCRDLGQLRPPAVFKINRDAFAAYAAARQSAGMRLGDIKPAALSGSLAWASKFDGSYHDAR